jgi:hypothetical protein
MKATKAQKAARAIASDFTQGPWPDRIELENAIAEAIEKAVKSERRACARIAADQVTWLWLEELGAKEPLAAAIIRARGRL